MNWPIGSGEQFRGVIDRRTREAICFLVRNAAVNGGMAPSLDDPEPLDLVEADLLDQAVEEMDCWKRRCGTGS